MVVAMVKTNSTALRNGDIKLTRRWHGWEGVREGLDKYLASGNEWLREEILRLLRSPFIEPVLERLQALGCDDMSIAGILCVALGAAQTPAPSAQERDRKVAKLRRIVAELRDLHASDPVLSLAGDLDVAADKVRAAAALQSDVAAFTRKPRHGNESARHAAMMTGMLLKAACGSAPPQVIADVLNLVLERDDIIRQSVEGWLRGTLADPSAS